MIGKIKPEMKWLLKSQTKCQATLHEPADLYSYRRFKEPQTDKNTAPTAQPELSDTFTTRVIKLYTRNVTAPA